MTINPKIRALLWEEYRTALPIAATLGAVGVSLIVWLSLGDTGAPHHLANQHARVFAVAVPLCAAVLLILNPANSGNLQGGFPDRILRLPVHTSAAAMIALTTRTLFVLSVGTVLAATSYVATGQTPGPNAVLLIGGLYLLIQTLDWLRKPAPALAYTLIAALLILLAAAAAGAIREHVQWNIPGTFYTPAIAAAFAVAFAVAAAVARLSVRAARSGVRVGALPIGGNSDIATIALTTRRDHFRSPFAAIVWHAWRQFGLILPALTLVVWLVITAALWLMATVDRANPYVKPEPFPYAAIFEYGSFLALAIAVMVWAPFFVVRGGRRGGNQGYTNLLPIPSETIARARLTAAAISIGITLAIATAISTASFLFGHQGAALDLLAESLAQQETTYREIAAYIVGIPLVTAYICWVTLSGGTRSSWLSIGAALGELALWIVLAGMLSVRNTDLAATVLIWTLVALLIAQCALSCMRTCRQGLLSRRARNVCVLAWTTVTLLAFPFSFLADADTAFVVGTFAASALFGGLAIMPYVSLVHHIDRKRHERDLPSNPLQHARSTQHTPQWRNLRWALITVAIATLVWLRWPAEPAVFAKWRAQGLPTNLEELDAWYPYVPPDKNLAPVLLTLNAKIEEARLRWLQSFGFSDDDAVNQGHRSAYDLVTSTLMIQGDADVDRAGPIPAEVWARTRDYHKKVVEPIVPELYDALRSRTACRVPIDLSKGWHADIWYMPIIRNLGRVLMVESLNHAIENDSQRATDAILALFPLARSLESVPLQSAQYTHAAVHEMGISAIEECLNRTQLANDDLIRITEALDTTLPPVGEKRFMDTGAIGEQTITVSALADPTFLRDAVFSSLRRTGRAVFPLFSPPLDVLRPTTFDRIGLARGYADAKQLAKEIGQTGVIPKRDDSDRDSGDFPDIARAPMTFILGGLPYNYYSAEWRLRTRFDVARTAVAVERYRLANNKLPASLNDLVPAYLDRVPGDMWNNAQPLKYRIKDNGEFVVYSLGPNRTDQLGEEKDATGEEFAYWNGDIQFTVAPVEKRVGLAN